MNSFKKINFEEEKMKKRIIGILFTAVLGLLLGVPLAGCNGTKEKDAEWVSLNTWFRTSGVPENVIEFAAVNETANLICTVEKEALWNCNVGEGECKQIVLSDGGITQTRWYQVSEEKFMYDYVDIVAKEGEHIVGYAVIKIEPTDFWYKAEIVKSVCFPQRFGEYQNISEEYVQSCIQKIKDINKEDER